MKNLSVLCIYTYGIVMGFQAYSIIEARTHVTLTQTAAVAAVTTTTNDSLLIKVLVSFASGSGIVGV